MGARVTKAKGQEVGIGAHSHGEREVQFGDHGQWLCSVPHGDRLRGKRDRFRHHYEPVSVGTALGTALGPGSSDPGAGARSFPLLSPALL